MESIHLHGKLSRFSYDHRKAQTTHLLLTTIEVMGILPRSRNTLCAMVKAGEILAIRCGRDNMFDPWELALWLEERQLGQRDQGAK
jgi:hypothetical protein